MKNILKASGINPEKKGEERDYEAEDAAETLMRAERHKGDHKLMKRVKKHLKTKKKDVISSLEQLRQIAKERGETMGENDHDEDDA